MGIKTIDTIKSFPRSIHILVIGEGISALAMGIFTFLQILYYNFIGLSPESIGLIFSLGSLFTLIGFFIGPFIKIFGRKNLLCIGVGILSLGIIIHVFFTNFLILLLSQIIISIGTSLIQVTELQLLYSYTIECKECCAYSYKYSVALISSALGILIGGNIDKLPFYLINGYKVLFLVAFIMLFLTGIMRYIFLPKDIKVDADLNEVKNILKASTQSMKMDKKIRNFAILLSLVVLSFSAVGPYNNLILKISFGLKNELISYISFLLTILSMIGIIMMPAIIEKSGVEKFNFFIFMGIIVSCILLSIIKSPVTFVVILIIRCIFAFMISSSLESLMMSNINTEYRDIFASVKMLVNGIAVSLGNFIGGIILNNLGYKGNYLYGAIASIVSLVYFYIKVKSYMENKTVVKECKCPFKQKKIVYKKD